MAAPALLQPMRHIPGASGWLRESQCAVLGVTVDHHNGCAILAASDRRRQVMVTLDALALLEYAAVLVEAAEQLQAAS